MVGRLTPALHRMAGATGELHLVMRAPGIPLEDEHGLKGLNS